MSITEGTYRNPTTGAEAFVFEFLGGMSCVLADGPTKISLDEFIASGPWQLTSTEVPEEAVGFVFDSAVQQLSKHRQLEEALVEQECPDKVGTFRHTTLGVEAYVFWSYSSRGLAGVMADGTYMVRPADMDAAGSWERISPTVPSQARSLLQSAIQRELAELGCLSNNANIVVSRDEKPKNHT